MPSLGVLVLLLCTQAPMCFGEWYETLTTKQRDYSSSYDTSYWFNQDLDHTDPLNIITWKQKYYKDFKHHYSGGPVILHVGGEGPADDPVNYDYLNVLASEIRAAIFVLEHRFYGDSHPTTDCRVEYLDKYFSIEQALADIAKFIYEMNKEHSLQEAKWFTYGGSYPGALSVFARVKYPHLIHGAIGASPGISSKVEYRQYMEIVAEAIYKIGGVKCIKNLLTVFGDLYDVMESESDQGRRDLERKLNICTGTLHKNQKRDVVFFFHLQLRKVIQYNNIDITKPTISSMCRHFETYAASQNPAYGLGEIIPTPIFCHNLDYNHDIEVKKKNDYSDSRVWVYHTCTEFGNLITTASPNQPLMGEDLHFKLDRCADIFGNKSYAALLKKNTENLRKQYGGINVALNITNAVIINSGMDPWVKLSYVPELYQRAMVETGPFKALRDKIYRLYSFLSITVKNPRADAHEVITKQIVAKLESYSTLPMNDFPEDLSPELRNVSKEYLENTRQFYTIYFPSVAHCAVMMESQYTDDPLLIQARLNLTRIV